MKNSKFKEALANFFNQHWARHEMTEIIGNKIININVDTCYEFEVCNDEVIRTEYFDLNCSGHEEADTSVQY